MNAQYKVLVADDSAEDRQITQFALRNNPHFHISAYVSNGDQVIAYLRGWYDFGDRNRYPLPDLLLLDLEMPLRDGFGVLRWLKAHPTDKLITIMLTSSDCAEHVAKAYALGANGYIIKPATARDLQEIGNRIFSVVSACQHAWLEGKPTPLLGHYTANGVGPGKYL
jgi:CheY-like chemotaxis protein